MGLFGHFRLVTMGECWECHPKLILRRAENPRRARPRPSIAEPRALWCRACIRIVRLWKRHWFRVDPYPRRGYLLFTIEHNGRHVRLATAYKAQERQNQHDTAGIHGPSPHSSKASRSRMFSVSSSLTRRSRPSIIFHVGTGLIALPPLTLSSSLTTSF
jgi:hypothetical protein